MRKISKFVIIFVIIFLTGCYKKESSKYIQSEKIVNDEATINLLISQVKGIETLPKTLDLYFEGTGNIKDYNNDDFLLYGLNMSENNLSLDYIKTNISSTFNKLNVENKSIDKYVFNDNIYSINSEYKRKNKMIISYIDRISTMYNYYYVIVYAGVVNNDEVYGDFNETSLVKLLYDNESFDTYEIDEKDKERFTKFRYKFERNYDGKYVFVEFEKL